MEDLEQAAAVEQTPAAEEVSPDLNQELEAIWNKQDEAPAPEVVEESEPEPVVEEPTVQEIIAPSDMPKGLKDHWAEIPEAARTAFETSQREMAAKMSDNARLTDAVRPIQSVLTKAVSEFPSLHGMKPEDAAREIFETARSFQNIQDRPLDVIMEIVESRGLQTQLAQKLTGNVPQQGQDVAELRSRLEQAQRQIAQFQDPNYMRETVSGVLNATKTEDAINEFASTAEHWQTVEPNMPTAIQLARAKLGETAPTKEVLSAAYELAVSQFVPQASKAQEQAADEVAQVPDPEKAQAARKAKSVNVSSTPTSKEKPLTMRQAMEQGWQRAHA